MKKIIVLTIGFLTLLPGVVWGKSMEELKKGPMLLITAEYTPYQRLIQPDLVSLFKQYNAAICVCVREDQLNDDLDKLYQVYESAGIPILFWPLLPMKDGLYINKHTTSAFLDYLDVIFKWADEHKHQILAIVVDVEPSYIPPKEGEKPPTLLQNLKRILKDLSKETFDASIPEFNKIIEKIHAHNALAVAAAFPFVVDDRKKGTHGWEDLFGGPIATVDWDYVALMMYTSWFVENGKIFGIDWDAAHYLAYDYSVDAKKIWGDKAAVAVGVTNPGQGHETVLYKTASEIAPAIAAVRQAGIQSIGIYDLKGILESGDIESWFKVLKDTPAGLPEKGKGKATSFRKLMSGAGSLLESLRNRD